MKLTDNFDSFEFNCKDGTIVPNELYSNMVELAKNLQVLRDELGKPVRINSAYRTPKYNKKVGGASKSQHLLCKAADIVVAGVTPLEVAETIERLIKEKKMVQGGIGIYNTFTHYDIRGVKARWNFTK
jgi:uncharacterized protein YcbK (DUF882 family)